MPWTPDLEGQGYVLILMVDRVGAHVKITSYDKWFARYHDLRAFCIMTLTFDLEG